MVLFSPLLFMKNLAKIFLENGLKIYEDLALVLPLCNASAHSVQKWKKLLASQKRDWFPVGLGRAGPGRVASLVEYSIHTNETSYTSFKS